jgi:hypothetical protein
MSSRGTNPDHHSIRLVLIVVAVVAALPLLSGAPGRQQPGSVAESEGRTPGLVADPTNSFTRVTPPRSLVARPATATITVTYNGFSAAAQAAFQAAINIWQTQVTSSVPIQVVANFTPLGSGVLGSAGATFYFRNFTNGVPNTWYPVALANKIAGTDLDPSSADITANFNSNFSNWYYGTDANTPAGQYDFESVVLHELGHGLGFAGSMSVSNGSGSFGSGSIYPFIYDTFAVNGSVQSLINTALFPNPSAALGSQLISDNLYWNGSQGVSGGGGSRPRLYAPSTWSSGSSYSHLNDATYPAGDANSLMTHALAAAEAIHDPGPITRGMFADMGWTVASATCTYSISPTTASYTASAGTGSVAVTTSSGCTWTAVSNTSFITVSSGGSGTGSGTVSYSVAANTGAARTGTITIAGQTFTVSQSGGCAYTISPTSASFAAAGGTGTVSITTAAGCAWTATSNTPFALIVGGAAGAGSSAISYTVSANTGAARSGTLTIAGQTFTVTQSAASTPAPGPTLTLSRTTLRFGAINNAGTLSAQTGTQSVTINQSGAGTASWTAAANQSWMTVTPSTGTGGGTVSVGINNTGGVLPASGTVTGTVTITAPSASNSPLTLSVTLVVYAASQATGAPFGSFDTPVNGTSGIAGAVAVTGWALDDIEVSRIAIYRASVAPEPSGQQVYVGDALLVSGARPDVETGNPTLPFNYRAGWGYQLLTNVLPGGGNGTYRLYAYAIDREGRSTLLGEKSFTAANATATRPFGAIDAPASGASVSGVTPVTGWALTPAPKTIPTDGSTITVYIDGVLVGTMAYNQARPDVAGLFPTYANSAGPGASRTVDTRPYSNGVHTISWNVFDNAGVGEGIGSRYFTIQNGSSLDAEVVASTVQAGLVGQPGTAGPISMSNEELMVRRGFDDMRPTEPIPLSEDGLFVVETRELERLVVYLPRAFGDTLAASSIVGESRHPLPIGSTLDGAAGVFVWAPGPGFVGTYDLAFAQRDGSIVRVRVVIRPQHQH